MDSRTRLLIILAAVAVILIACLCVCVAAGLYFGESYASGILTATAEAEYSPFDGTPVPGQPAPAVPPAAPPGQQAPAPIPQTIPAPVPPPGQPQAVPAGRPANMTPEEQAYFDGFVDQTQRWDESRSRFEALTANRRPEDSTWQSEMLGQLAAWRGLASQARDLQAPPRFASVQQQYLEAVQQFDNAADAMTQALNGSDMTGFAAASPQISAGDAALAQARNQLSQIR